MFTGSGKPTAIASGRLGHLDRTQGEVGKIFLTGHPTGTPATAGTGVSAQADTDVSSHGRLAVDPVLMSGYARRPGSRQGSALTQSVRQEAVDGSGNNPSPALGTPTATHPN
ncbi:hypothetical protein [Streptomyces mirabilis]|uniref:hypothetical protein n=1 Tax=Streptomyces mirabilis TaxID=68239 RepID=UPI0036D05543